MTKCLFLILAVICSFTSGKFEATTELDLGDGITKLRKYDIEMLSGSKLEFKDWSAWANWSNSSFRKQFIPDLADTDFTELGQKKYIFKANKNINTTTLKTNVIKALKKADGKPIEELEKNYEYKSIQKIYLFFNLFSNNIRQNYKSSEKKKMIQK